MKILRGPLMNFDMMTDYWIAQAWNESDDEDFRSLPYIDSPVQTFSSTPKIDPAWGLRGLSSQKLLRNEFEEMHKTLKVWQVGH